ncbi:hypothetical protein RF11_14826 [Thelohanellus kitauei]|uniref:Uncharacterized protein n=1 Tax=Thelohanellus kitauei TaxID=669202 RepID=A0A0C2N9C1_THEKT|nr:hypothetical protein RF11_14826 [Thelohanellus kitauei]
MNIINNIKLQYLKRFKKIENLPASHLCTAYLFHQLYFIPGIVSLTSSKTRHDPDYFDRLQFVDKIDDLTQYILPKTRQFTLPLQLVKKVAFYPNADFITSKTAPPIDLNNETLSPDSEDLDDDFAKGDAYFCKITSLVPANKEYLGLLDVSWVSEKKKESHKSIIILLLTKKR